MILLNASYNFLEKESTSKCKHSLFVKNAFEVNYPLLRKAEIVILCGEAKKMVEPIRVGLYSRPTSIFTS